MTACSSKDDLANEQKTPKEIKITTSIEGMSTRAVENDVNLQNTAFYNGANINVYFTNSTTDNPIAPLTAESPYATYSYDGTDWSTATTGLYYPINGDGIKAFGIYPSTDIDGNPITKNTTTFTVIDSYDLQNTDALYRQSDLMYAYKSGNSSWSESNSIPLKFQHCMTKIVVKIVLDNEVITKEQFQNMFSEIYVYCNTTASLSFDDNKIKASADWNNGDIIFVNDRSELNLQNGNTCIIPPQAVPGNTDFIYINCGAQEFYWRTPAEGYTFEGGKKYVFTLSITNKAAGIAAPTVKGWEDGANISEDAE